MNIASFALTAAVVAALGYAQPASAQTQDQTGATNRSGPMMNGQGRASATTGTASDERSANEHDDDNNTATDRGDDWNPGRHWSGNWHMRMGMGPMGWQRPMMRALGGAQFHFARGNSRIDVRCSVQEDTRACVQAATKLLDAIAQMRNGGHADRSGAALDDDNGETNGSAAHPNDRRNEGTPSAPGERM
jgi:hypothetical protein